MDPDQLTGCTLLQNGIYPGAGCYKGFSDDGDSLLSCQPRVTVLSCFIYKVIRDLESIDHLCINLIRRIGLIHK